MKVSDDVLRQYTVKMDANIDPDARPEDVDQTVVDPRLGKPAAEAKGEASEEEKPEAEAKAKAEGEKGGEKKVEKKEKEESGDAKTAASDEEKGDDE
jgi:membrane protein involved in colicin uptake